MFAQFTRWFAPARGDETPTHHLYIALVTQARQPVFYAQWGVPDTLDGRFEMILLHLFLLTRRLRDAKREETARQLVEIFFNDMDRSLREIGVGDMSVGKKVKAMARAYNGRLTVYEDSFNDPARLAQALARNVFGTVSTPPSPQPLADYMRRAEAGLAAQPLEALEAGQIDWPSC